MACAAALCCTAARRAPALSSVCFLCFSASTRTPPCTGSCLCATARCARAPQPPALLLCVAQQHSAHLLCLLFVFCSFLLVLVHPHVLVVVFVLLLVALAPPSQLRCCSVLHSSTARTCFVFCSFSVLFC